MTAAWPAGGREGRLTERFMDGSWAASWGFSVGLCVRRDRNRGTLGDGCAGFFLPVAIYTDIYLFIRPAIHATRNQRGRVSSRRGRGEGQVTYSLDGVLILEISSLVCRSSRQCLCTRRPVSKC
jgi:hypothetical protein